ncbi:MAG: PAS domain S-box protein [Desulfobacterales bacterium]|nr:PAS domain S-box protein [Desulfobacterales bacterium]
MKLPIITDINRAAGKEPLMRWIAILLPLVLLIFLVQGNLQSYRAARALSFQLTRNQSAAVAEELALRMDLLIQKSSRGLALLSNLWREAPKANQRTTFLKWANGLVATDPIFDLILYLDADNIMMVTPPSSSKPLVGLDIQSRPAKEDLFKTLRKSIAPLDAPPTARITSKGALVLWFPVLVKGEEAGTMAGALRLKDILDQALTPMIRDQFRIRIRAGEQDVFNSGTDSFNAVEEELKGIKEVSLVGVNWQVSVWPKGGGAYHKLRPSDLRRLLFMVILSFFVSGFLGISLYALHRIQRTRRSRMRSEKRYQTLFNSAIDGIMVMDNTGRILDANPALCASLGYELAELTTMNFSRILGQESAGELPDILDRLRKNEEVSCEVSHQSREGRRVHVEMGARSFEYMGMAAVLIMSRDISRRKRAVRALAESEERLKAIFEQAGVGIMQCGPDYRVQQANDRLCRILGYTREELTGMSYWDYCFPEERTETDNRVEEMSRSGVSTGTWKKRLRHKSGKAIRVRMTTTLIWSRAGKYLYSIDVVEDITRQHRLELQLRQAQKMESIGVLAGGIAHDFNNILGSILGFTQMALLDAPAGGKTRQRLEQVFKAANLAKELVRQILTFSRRSEDSPQAIRVSPIIKETLKFLKALFPGNVSIEHDLRDMDGQVMADPTQIHQVLMNLCTNGAQAMAPEGGTLSVALYRESVGEDRAGETGMMTGDYVVIRVSDTGIGIDPKVQDRIFEPYYTTKEAGEGTGMGLAVVHGIVREYEGRVMVESSPGRGADFKVYLPEAEAGEFLPDGTETDLPRGRERLIFIDDNQSLLMAGKEMMAHLGYTVEVFSDPVTALKRMAEGPVNFSGVITDYTMPGMTGAELAERVLDLYPDLPVILCTGNSRNLNFEELLHSGINSILIKPLILEELAPALRAALKTETDRGPEPPEDSEGPRPKGEKYEI